MVIFVGGGAILFRGFHQWRKAKPEKNSRKISKPTPKSEKPIDEYISRVEEELRKRSKG
jgi:hypothetical protein